MIFKNISARPEYEDKYRKYRNVLTTVLKNAKRLYYSRVFEENKGNTGKTWNTINELLHSGNSSKKITEVEQLCINTNEGDKILHSDHEIATAFNEFFVNIGPNLAKEIPENDFDFKEYLGDKNNKSLFFKPVSNSEVVNHLLALDTRKACGYDNMPPRQARN